MDRQNSTDGVGMVKDVLKFFGIRILIGLCVACIGILISVWKHDWNISFNWFSLGGLILTAMGALPFLPSSKRVRLVTYTSYMGDDAVADEKERFASGARWALTCIVIGLINLIVPVLVYLLAVHHT